MLSVRWALSRPSMMSSHGSPEGSLSLPYVKIRNHLRSALGMMRSGAEVGPGRELVEPLAEVDFRRETAQFVVVRIGLLESGAQLDRRFPCSADSLIARRRSESMRTTGMSSMAARCDTGRCSASARVVTSFMSVASLGRRRTRKVILRISVQACASRSWANAFEHPLRRDRMKHKLREQVAQG